MSPNFSAARQRNLLRHAELTQIRINKFGPNRPRIKLSQLPELMTADALVDNLTATECRETLRQILLAIESANKTGPDKAIAAMGEAIADAAAWAEEMMGGSA